MNERYLMLDCPAGISGDMFVAAMIDLGVDEKKLKDALSGLPLSGAEIRISRVKKSGLDVCDFLVQPDAAHENHDHDMAYLHGHAHAWEASNEHGQEHRKEHAHVHGREPVHEHRKEHAHVHDREPVHEHRNLSDVYHILEQGRLSARALALAKKIFRILAEAESRAHGLPIEEVHFHEVGAIDSILDIAAAAVCLDEIGVDRVIVSALTEGCGTVRCQHGLLPIPVPAVAQIAQSYQLPLKVTDVSGELVTPTGAAIAAAIRTDKRPPDSFRILKTGMGAGKREYATCGFLRILLIETESTGRPENTDSGYDTETEDAVKEEKTAETAEKPEIQGEILKLEANIDDCSGELLGHCMERLFAAGARDVYYQPVYMKKNRPAWQLNVICSRERAERLEQIMFRETTTIGIRKIHLERTVLEREQITLESALGPMQAKRCRIPAGAGYPERVRYYPEYESLVKLAERQGIALGDVYRAFEQACAHIPERKH